MAEILYFRSYNPSAAPHALAEGELAAAENIDFAIEPGAAAVRRGSVVFGTAHSTAGVIGLYRQYGTNLGASPYYMAVDLGSTDKGAVYRGTFGGSPAQLTVTSTLVASNGAQEVVAFGGYKNWALIASGTKNLKDDGANTTEWIKQTSGAPAVTVTTLTGLAVFAGTYAAQEGTLGASASGTATGTTDATTNRLTLLGTLSTTNLNANGTNTIGDYGVHFLDIQFDRPELVSRVSRDYSIGDTSFASYLHTEMDIELNPEGLAALADTEVLVEGENASGEDKQEAIGDARQATRPPLTRISAAANVFNAWAVPRPKYEFVGRYSGTNGLNPWESIQAVRVVVEASGPVEVTIKDWEVRGAEAYPLNDMGAGYRWFVTYATIADGLVVGEGAPSAASDIKRCQYALATVTGTTPSGSVHGVTHLKFYRQGGRLADAYCVGTATLPTVTLVDTLGDIPALMAGPSAILERNLWAQADWSGAVGAISEPFYDRIFLGYENYLSWSLPGRPDAIPKTSKARVSHGGDHVQGLVVWNNLVVVNRDSVYEVSGDVFEGQASNYSVVRSGSRHGSKARRTIIKTPYGIPLLDYDGIFLYQPGSGQDIPIQWAIDKIGDAFKGIGDFDPAHLKGDRCPAINKSYLSRSVACFANDKLYLAVPSGSNTYNNMVWVLDFVTKTTQYYVYPFIIVSMWWDFDDNRLLAGTTDGKVMQIEQGTIDTLANGSTAGIVWKVKTPVWSADTDTVFENLALEYQDGHAAQVLAAYDYPISAAAPPSGTEGGASITLATLTGKQKNWVMPPMDGQTRRSVWFDISGTSTGTQRPTLYQLKFDALKHPPRVHYWRTDHDKAGSDGEKRWDVQYHDIEIFGTATASSTSTIAGTFTNTGTVTAVTFIDNVAVSTVVGTATTTGVTMEGVNGGRGIAVFALPPETYGRVAYTTYTATDGQFKIWRSYFDAQAEPSRVNFAQADDAKPEEESIVDGWDAILNPNGTVTSVLFVDNVAVATALATGTVRQSYPFTAPPETYGRTVFATYTGTAFKHYLTWYHLRQEPDRWSSYVSDREYSDAENWYHAHGAILDCLGNTVLGTVVIDGTAVSTFTFTGSGQTSYSNALPSEKYGAAAFTKYVAVSGRFKHYKTWYDASKEPDRLKFAETDNQALPSENYAKTWVPTVNPLGGSVVGIAYVDGTAVSTATFTGTVKKAWEIGLPLITAGKTVKATYTSLTPFKHYQTDWEFEAKPFGKKNWLVTYTKIGGASQLDMPLFWALEVEPVGTATVTAVLDIDGTPFTTQTLTFTGREYRDRLRLPPGARGYVFQQRLSSPSDFRVWRSNLDGEHIGVKGMARQGWKGTPQ